MTAAVPLKEQIAAEHVAYRRRCGWTIADCAEEIRRAFLVFRVSPPVARPKSWNHIRRCYAHAWLCLGISDERARRLDQGGTA